MLEPMRCRVVIRLQPQPAAAAQLAIGLTAAAAAVRRVRRRAAAAAAVTIMIMIITTAAAAAEQVLAHENGPVSAAEI